MPKSPQEWSSEEKLEALLESSKLSEEELGKYLRRRGLHAAQLEEWRSLAKEGLSPVKGQSESRRIRKLEKEICRKDKALAETAALLVLQKKVNAIWGEEDATTEPNSEE